MTKEITVASVELPQRIKAIHAGGGVITRMSVERGTYTLTVRWNEQPELTNETNAATSQPEAVARDVVGGKKLKESFPAAIPARVSSIHEGNDDTKLTVICL